MANTTWHIGVATGLVVGLAATVPAFGAEPEIPAIRILVHAVTTIPPDRLVRAQAEATRIYAAVGVRLVWTDPLPTLPRITMMIVSNPDDLPTVVGADALGVAPAADEGVGRLAYAYYVRIVASADQHSIDVAKLLGYVIAHELGHILLARGSHSSAGVMSGRWGQFEMDLVADDLLRFTNEQAKLIRNSVAAMNADHKRQSGIVVK